MLKNINKFIKLTLLFTAIYLLAFAFISSHYFSDFMANNWIPDYIHNIRPLFFIFNFFPIWIAYYLAYLGCMIVSVVCGVVALKQIYKTKEKLNWFILLLTLFNILIFVLNLGYILKLWQ